MLDAIATLDKVVKYVDIPLQHSHPEILKLMNRPAFDYRELINKIRTIIPDVSIRTAFIVGYPGETEKHFRSLSSIRKSIRSIFGIKKNQPLYISKTLFLIPISNNIKYIE